MRVFSANKNYIPNMLFITSMLRFSHNRKNQINYVFRLFIRLGGLGDRLKTKKILIEKIN